MKPRLKRSPHSPRGEWMCTGDHLTGYGRTPALAFCAWQTIRRYLEQLVKQPPPPVQWYPQTPPAWPRHDTVFYADRTRVRQ